MVVGPQEPFAIKGDEPARLKYGKLTIIAIKQQDIIGRSMRSITVFCTHQNNQNPA